MWVRSLGQEDPPEEDIATHSSVLACRIILAMDRGAWLAIVHRVAKSHIWLKPLITHVHMHTGVIKSEWGILDPLYYYFIQPYSQSRMICPHATKIVYTYVFYISILIYVSNNMIKIILLLPLWPWSMDRGEWQTTVPGVTKSQTWLTKHPR